MRFTRSTLLLWLPLLAAVGCASTPSRVAETSARAKPFVTALAAYHRDTGDYPEDLENLHPRYVNADARYYDNEDPKSGWRLIYLRVDRDHFQLRMDSAPCSMAVLDEKGRVTAACGPNYQ